MTGLDPEELLAIQADLRAQGLDDQTSPEDVVASYSLYQQMKPISMEPEPIRPAAGPDWDYSTMGDPLAEPLDEAIPPEPPTDSPEGVESLAPPESPEGLYPPQV